MKLIDTMVNKIIISTLRRRGKKVLQLLDEKSANAPQVNEELLLRIIRDNKDTEYGRKCGFADIHSIEDFKKKVPFTEYDHYAPYIERMINNDEKNLITVYPIVHYALSSGSIGVPKHIPVSRETLDIYGMHLPRIFGVGDEYERAHGGKKFPAGRGLNTLEIAIDYTPNGVTKGAISAAAADDSKKIFPYFFTSPNDVIIPPEDMDLKYFKLRYALEDPDITFMCSAFMTGLVDLMNYMVHNWQVLCDDIARGNISPDIKVPDDVRQRLEAQMKPNAKRALELRREFRKGFDTPIVPRIWPRLRLVTAIGTGGFLAHTEKMRTFLGTNIPIEFAAYAASESMMAVARHAEEMEYILLPHAAFYEFIPMDCDDEETTYTMDQLEVGKEYEIVLTNLSGFYRYKIKDVVRVTGYYKKNPKICFVYRKNQMLSIAGEKTNDESVQWAVRQTGKKTGYEFIDYCVYADTDSDPGHYEVLVEPDRQVDPADLPRIRNTLDEKLGEANPSYGTKVKTGVLGAMGVSISQLETHALYREMQIAKGISGNQLKPVRVLDTPMKEKFFFTLIEEGMHERG